MAGYMKTSKTVEWSTPQALYDELDREFGPFDLDPCCTPENAKCLRHYTKEDNGLDQDWSGARVFMNPPYGRTELRAWMKKAYTEARDNGALVVCLVPSRTDTRWWHEYAAKGEYRFIKSRVHFGGSENCAPFPSVIVIFRPGKDREYLKMALAKTGASPCQRKKVGAVLVGSDGQILSTGSNAPPPGTDPCSACPRDAGNMPENIGYDVCLTVHAEQNCLLQAAGRTEGSTIYLATVDNSTGAIIPRLPCPICARLLVQAGVKDVVVLNSDPESLHIPAHQVWSEYVSEIRGQVTPSA